MSHTDELRSVRQLLNDFSVRRVPLRRGSWPHGSQAGGGWNAGIEMRATAKRAERDDVAK